MPFINGRYYINPTMGAAIEAARRQASPSRASNATEGPLVDQSDASAIIDRDADPWRDGDQLESRPDEHGPIHRIEIEAAEVVPSSTGRATRGFVARVHRHAPVSANVAPAASGPPAGNSTPLRAETHAFTDHRDLLDFLVDELSKDHRNC